MLDLTWKEIAMGMLSVATLGIAGAVRALFAKVDAKAEKTDLATLIDRLDTHTERIFDKLEDTDKTVTNIAVAVARLEGRNSV